jgi:hypothetical protein
MHVTGGTAAAQRQQFAVQGPWQQADVGNVGLAGSASETGDGDLIMNGAGSDIWGTADSFHFLYQPIEDGTIRANGPTFTSNPNDPFAKIGIMIRLTLDPGSPEVILDMKPDGSIEFMTRSAQNGETTFIAGLNQRGSNLSLVRNNGVVSGIVCGNGCVTVGSTPFPSGPALIGAAITSHDPTRLAEAMFPASPPSVRTVPDPWVTGDEGAVGLRGSAYFQQGTFTVSGAGADIWGTSDAYRTVDTTQNGNGTIAARVVSENGANTFAKAGIVAAPFGRTGPTVILDARPDGSIEFMARATQGGEMAFVAGSSAAFPMWLKLQRTGNTFTGFVSPDGSAWQMVGSTDVSMPTNITVGMAVTSHDTSALNTATFDHVSVSSAAPIDTDIGDVGATGGVAVSDVNTRVLGAGADIWGTQDAFNYYYTSLINDGQMFVRVTSLDNTSPFAKAGIMIRASTDPSAAHVILDVKPDGGVEFMMRSVAGGSTTFLAGTTRSFPVQLYLQRTGTTINAYVVDVNQLTPVGSVTTDLPSDALIGIAVTSHTRGTLATATLDQISR